MNPTRIWQDSLEDGPAVRRPGHGRRGAAHRPDPRRLPRRPPADRADRPPARSQPGTRPAARRDSRRGRRARAAGSRRAHRDGPAGPARRRPPPRHARRLGGFFTLVADRNGEEPKRVGPAETFDEVLWNIGLRDLVLTLPGHFARSYAAERFGIRYVPLADAAPVAFLLAVPRAGARPLVAAFCEIAHQVTGELLALVPGARRAPPPIATA